MFKTIGEWEKLSAEERLIILSVALELSRVPGLDAKLSGVLSNSGFSRQEFDKITEKLEIKGLISIRRPAYMSCDYVHLTGEAASDSLLRFGRIK